MWLLWCSGGSTDDYKREDEQRIVVVLFIVVLDVVFVLVVSARHAEQSRITMDTDNDNDIQQSSEAWPYRRECRGHDPAKKESVRAGVACTVGKVCTCTLSMTVCSKSDLNEKHL